VSELRHRTRIFHRRERSPRTTLPAGRR
jgi:hypothetical protein